MFIFSFCVNTGFISLGLISRHEIARSYDMCMFTRVVKVLVAQPCLTL